MAIFKDIPRFDDTGITEYYRVNDGKVVKLSSDYDSLDDKPTINGVTIEGDLTTETLNIPIGNIEELRTDIKDNLVNAINELSIETESFANFITDKVNSIISFTILWVDALPSDENAKQNTVYLVPKKSMIEDDNYCEEYLYTDHGWEKIGDTKVDLSGYYTKTETDSIVETMMGQIQITYATKAEVNQSLSNLSQNINQSITDLSQAVNNTIGDLTALDTDTKDNIVSAINEVNSNTSNVVTVVNKGMDFNSNKYPEVIAEINKKLSKYDSVIVRVLPSNYDEYEFCLTRGAINERLGQTHWMTVTVTTFYNPSTGSMGKYITQGGYSSARENSITNFNIYSWKDTIATEKRVAELTLAKNNTTSFTPTKEYHPATKQYVDDAIQTGIDSIDENIYRIVLTTNTRSNTGNGSSNLNATDRQAYADWLTWYQSKLGTPTVLEFYCTGNYFGAPSGTHKHLLGRIEFNGGALAANKDICVTGMYAYNVNGGTMDTMTGRVGDPICTFYVTRIYFRTDIDSNGNYIPHSSFNGTYTTSPCTFGDIDYQNSMVDKRTWLNTVAYTPTTDYNAATKKYVDDSITSAIGDIVSFGVELVDELPTENISSSTVYMVPAAEAGEQNVREEYLYTEHGWEMVGSTQINLENYYATEDEVLNILYPQTGGAING